MMIHSNTSILVADEQPLVAQAISGALGREAGFTMLAPISSSGLDAFEAVLSQQPDITLLDYWMPDIEGPAVVRLVHARRPGSKIILTSWFHTSREIDNALLAGASGFFPKSMGLNEVAEGIRKSLSGSGPILPAELHRKDVGSLQPREEMATMWARLERLSRRQVEVIGLISLDLSVSEIGKELSISPGTVKVHVRNILAKTHSSSQREVLRLARSSGLIRN